MKPHFLQSRAWEDFQHSLGNEIITGKGDGWSYLAMVENDRFGKFVYAPYGPFAKNKRSLVNAVNHLKSSAQKIGAYVLIVEPYLPITREEAKSIFKFSAPYRQPDATILIDLSKSEDEILAQMNQSRRNEHRNHTKKGLKITKTNDPKKIEILYELLKINSNEKNFFVRDKKFFDVMSTTLLKNGDANLYIGEYDKKPVIAALAYDDNDTSYYTFVGRDYTFNKLPTNGPVVSTMILDAKKRGKKFFDLYGITLNEKSNDPKSGFTRFKKTFGGDVVKLSGTWEIPVKILPFIMRRVLNKISTIIKGERH